MRRQNPFIMRSKTTPRICVASSTRKGPRYMQCLLLVCCCWSIPATGYAALMPTTATGWGPDDFNTSTLKPSPAIPVFSCPWIDSGLAAWLAAVPDRVNNWRFSYSSLTNLNRDLTINDYFAWVVDEPTVTAPDGAQYGGRFHEDRGGAVFSLTYTPQPGDPADIHWIQAVSADYNGATDIHLDNPFDRTVPFYDPAGASGRLPNGTSWFLDIPSAPENEIEDFYANVEFQVLLAVDNVNPTGFHSVTLYGGEWWGYQYRTADVGPVPEPATFLLVGTSGLLTIWKRRKVFAPGSGSRRG